MFALIGAGMSIYLSKVNMPNTVTYKNWTLSLSGI